MRYMAGDSLIGRLAQGPLATAAAAKILQRIGAALDAAHAQHIIHRDLKPGNILFDKHGDAFLSDFGVAKMLEASAALTGVGGLMGTPAYMSPEQVHGDSQLDGRSDVYALGVLLFEMLTGHVPYQADTPARQMMKHVLEPVPHILEVKPDLPSQCESVIARAMAKDRDDRYATAREMVAALTVISGREPVTPLLRFSETVEAHRQEESPETMPPPAKPASSLPQTLQWQWLTPIE